MACTPRLDPEIWKPEPETLIWGWDPQDLAPEHLLSGAGISTSTWNPKTWNMDLQIWKLNLKISHLKPQI